MRLRWIDSNGVSSHDLADLPKRKDGILWLDIREWSDEARRCWRVISASIPSRSAKVRSAITCPRVHVCPHHAFIVVHAPEIGGRRPRALSRAGPVRRRKVLGHHPWTP
jgi:hypothetical protein